MRYFLFDALLVFIRNLIIIRDKYQSDIYLCIFISLPYYPTLLITRSSFGPFRSDNGDCALSTSRVHFLHILGPVHNLISKL
jgi:hypothetical protein